MPLTIEEILAQLGTKPAQELFPTEQATDSVQPSDAGLLQDLLSGTAPVSADILREREDVKPERSGTGQRVRAGVADALRSFASVNTGRGIPQNRALDQLRQRREGESERKRQDLLLRAGQAEKGEARDAQTTQREIDRQRSEERQDELLTEQRKFQTEMLEGKQEFEERITTANRASSEEISRLGRETQMAIAELQVSARSDSGKKGMFEANTQKVSDLRKSLIVTMDEIRSGKDKRSLEEIKQEFMLLSDAELFGLDSDRNPFMAQLELFFEKHVASAVESRDANAQSAQISTPNMAIGGAAGILGIPDALRNLGQAGISMPSIPNIPGPAGVTKNTIP